MRRISLGVATAVAAVALVACGGDGDEPETTGGSAAGPARGDLAEQTGPEVMRAAAAALREVDSVHVAAAGNEVSFDLRLAAPDGAVGTFSSEGVEADLVRVDGTTYVRYGEPLPPEIEGTIEPGQWVETADGAFGDLTIASLADEIAAVADEAKAEVQSVTEAGQAAVLVETTDGFKLWVSDEGEALPLREIDEDGIEGSFADYDAQVGLEAPPASDVVTLAPAPTT